MSYTPHLSPSQEDNLATRLNPDIWLLIFRFASRPYVFPELQRSVLEKTTYDSVNSPRQWEDAILEEYDSSLAMLSNLRLVCRAWDLPLRQDRFIWTIVANKMPVRELIQLGAGSAFLPIRRLEVYRVIPSTGNNVQATADDLATLIEYCRHLQVLMVIPSDVYDPEEDVALGALYHRKIVAALLNNVNILRYEVRGLVAPNPEQISLLLNNCPSLETLDIVPVASQTVVRMPVAVAPSLQSIRLTFHVPAVELLRGLSNSQLPSLQYVWIDDHVERDEEPEVDAFTAAVKVFIETHGSTLRTLVSRTHNSCLTMQMWNTTIASCPNLEEFLCSLPTDSDFAFSRPTLGLPHQNLKLVVIEDFRRWMVEAAARGIRNQNTLSFLQSFTPTDFPGLRTIRVDVRRRDTRVDWGPTQFRFCGTLLDRMEPHAGSEVVVENMDGVALRSVISGH